MSDKFEPKYEGIITEILPAGFFLIESEGRKVRAYVGGKMRKNHITLIIGDKVLFVCPPQAAQGRILRRL